MKSDNYFIVGFCTNKFLSFSFFSYCFPAFQMVYFLGEVAHNDKSLISNINYCLMIVLYII